LLKIVYAAGNTLNSKISLLRFLREVEGKPYQIKIAAFTKSSLKNYNIDWTLDCILNIKAPEKLQLDSQNFRIYHEQIKSFSPNLIISDLDVATSYIANDLNIPLWQCSSYLINVGLDKLFMRRKGVDVFKYYRQLANAQKEKNQYINNITNNSDRNFIYSHLCDTVKCPLLSPGFDWIRPYYYLGKISSPCRHDITTALIDNNKKVLNVLKQYSDVVSFSENWQEKYDKIYSKDINNLAEYICNLKNSRLFVCRGESNYLADAFYNGKFTAIFPNLFDLDCLINSLYAKYAETGQLFFDETFDLSVIYDREVTVNYNPNVKFLHEKIEELF